MLKICFYHTCACFLLFFASAQEKHRVFIFTDINIDSGDPDDRQSLVHLFWYANELQIEGIVPERWNARSVEACNLALDSYAEDYKAFGFNKHGYPNPEELKKKIAKDDTEVLELFAKAAENKKSPLYVLIWGNMLAFNKALYQISWIWQTTLELLLLELAPCLKKTIHICRKVGLRPIYHVSNITGMDLEEMICITTRSLQICGGSKLTGLIMECLRVSEPREMFHKLAKYGNMGQHIKEVVKNEDWAQYFRVGDTPSVLYVIDPNHDINDPEQSSWAGQFKKPFPQNRPNYYTDFCGTLNWDYANPCNTWEIHEQVAKLATQTLEKRRNEMYQALLEKLTKIYKLK